MVRDSLPKGRPPLGAVWPLALVLLLGAVWCGYWFVGHAGAREGFERWRESEARRGRELTCGERSHGGFPFRFELTCSDVTITLKGGDGPAVVRVGAIRAVSQAYAPNRVIAEFTGPMTIEADDGTVAEVGWSGARMSMRLLPTAEGRVRASRADLAVDQPVLNVVPETGATMFAYRAHAFEAHFRETVGSDSATFAHDFALTTHAPRINLPDGTARAADRFDVLGRTTGIEGLPNGDWPAWLTGWRDRGGRVFLDTARLAFGQSLVLLDGQIRLDGAGRPAGVINVTTAGVDLGAFPVDDMLGLTGVAALSIGALGSPIDVEGRSGSRIGFRMADGTLYIGPIGLTGLPSLLR